MSDNVLKNRCMYSTAIMNTFKVFMAFFNSGGSGIEIKTVEENSDTKNFNMVASP